MTWACDAYGQEGIDIGALCFVAPQNGRKCRAQLECRITMQTVRRRLWERLMALAAAGDATAQYVLRDLTGPEQLLTASSPCDLDRERPSPKPASPESLT